MVLKRKGEKRWHNHGIMTKLKLDMDTHSYFFKTKADSVDEMEGTAYYRVRSRSRVWKLVKLTLRLPSEGRGRSEILKGGRSRYTTYSYYMCLYEKGVRSDYRNRSVSAAITGTTITKQSHVEARRNYHLLDNNNSGSPRKQEHPNDTKREEEEGRNWTRRFRVKEKELF